MLIRVRSQLEEDECWPGIDHARCGSGSDFGVMEAIDEWAHRVGVTKLWISFDVDSLDPFFARERGLKCAVD
ncbi:MAG: hypothetical protein R2688_06325 [Fimbriimonadaceae bacterium]